VVCEDITSSTRFRFVDAQTQHGHTLNKLTHRKVNALYEPFGDRQPVSSHRRVSSTIFATKYRVSGKEASPISEKSRVYLVIPDAVGYPLRPL